MCCKNGNGNEVSGDGGGSGCLRWVGVETTCDLDGQNCVSVAIYVPVDCSTEKQLANSFGDCPECIVPIDESIGILPPRDSTTDEVAGDDCNTSKEDLKKVFPNISDANAELLASVINEKGTDFGIDTVEKMQHFLAQAGHEVGEFVNGLSQTESLYYTTTDRLKSVYKKYFWQNLTDTIDKRNPADYLKNSSKVANYVYCCRMGNGTEASGDGYKYRGRGVFQITGRDNYTAFETFYNEKFDPDVDLVSSPDILSSNNELAVISALWYYKTNVIDKISIDSTTTVKKVTTKVNGGTNGLSHRKQIHTIAKDSIECL